MENGNSENGTFDYDLVTIGAGSGGVRASRVAAGTYGAKVCQISNLVCLLCTAAETEKHHRIKLFLFVHSSPNV